MSFFFQTIEIPAWFIVFVLGSAAPLWLRWSKKFYKKFIRTGKLQKVFERKKSDEERKQDILKKASEHYRENSELSELSNNKKKSKSQKKRIDPEKRENIKTVLKVLAASAETGVLSKSVADKCNISPLETTNALNYLTAKEYAELVNSPTGSKYYLTDLGRRYCINKKYI